MKIYIFVLLVAATQAFIYERDDSTDEIIDCGEEFIQWCHLIDVDYDAFEQGDDLELYGVVLQYVNRTDGDFFGSYGHSYMSDDGESYAFLVFSALGQSMHLDGHIQLSSNEYYIVGNCGDDCQVLILEEDGKMAPHEIDYEFETLPTDDELDAETRELFAKGRTSDTETEVSAIFYYTSKFKEVTSDPATFINAEVTKLNAGYKNSKIPLKVKVHCVQSIDLDEPADSQKRIDNFKAKKGSVPNLLNSADIAVLFTGTTVNLGGGYICGQVDSINIPRSKGAPVTWVAKNCGYNLAHEVGHLFGGRHNREQDPGDNFVNYAHGFLIKGSKFHTIMAYESYAQPQTVNYYSNIEQKIGNPKVAMGDDKNNVVRIIRETRDAMSKIGDESKTCGSGSGGSGGSGGSSGASSCTNEWGDFYCQDIAAYKECDYIVWGSSPQENIHKYCKKACGKC